MAGVIAGSIVLEILGDKTPITATLASLQAAQKPITVQINSAAAQNSVLGLTAKVTGLDSAVVSVTARLGTLNSEVQILGALGRAAFANMGIAVAGTSGNVATLNTQIGNTTTTVNRLTSAWQANGAAARASQSAGINNGAALIGKAGGFSGAGMGGAALGLSFISPTAGLAAMALQLGPVVAGLVAAGLAAKTLGDGIDKAAVFGRGLSQIGAISHQSAQEMNVFGKYVQQLSTDLPLTTQQLMELGRQAVLVGLHGSEGIHTYTENMAALSIVLRDVDGNSQGVEQVGQEVVKVMRSMGATTADVSAQFAGNVNSLVALKTEFGVQVPLITGLSKFWSSYGHEIGLTTDQVYGWSAALVSVGARAQGAGTALQKFFQVTTKDASAGAAGMGTFAKIMHMTGDEALNLIKTDPSAFLKKFIDSLPNFMRDGKDSAGVLASLGLTSAQVIRAFTELATSSGNVDRALAVAKGGMTDTGLAMRTAKDATDNYKDRVVELGHAWDAFKTNIGAAILPMLSDLLNAVTPIAEEIFKLSQDLAGLKSPEAIQAVLIIKPGDDFTTQALKVLIGTGIGVKDLVALPVKAISDTISASDLQVQLLKRGILKDAGSILTGGLPGSGPLAQLQRIKDDMPYYIKVVKDFDAVQAKALANPGRTLAMNTPGVLNAFGMAAPAGGNLNQTANDLGFSFIQGLTSGPNAVKGNSKLAAWCADVASQIQAKLGSNIKATASAGGLRQNALDAGYIQVSQADARPGDLVFYRGKGYGANNSGNHVETVEGMKNGKLMLVGASGSTNTRELPFYDPAHATFLRAPTSPFAGKNIGQGLPAVTPTPPDAPSGPSIKELEARLKTVQGRMTVAGDAAGKYAGNLRELQAAALLAAHSQVEGSDDWNKAIQIYGSATSALKGLDKGTKEYVASRKDFNTYGQQALDLIKKQEAAQKSGSATEIEAARGAIVQFQARGQAAKAVFGAEDAAHKQLVTNQSQADAESKRVQQALNRGRVLDAQTALEHLKVIQQQELDSVGDSQAKRLTVVKQTSQQIYDAEMALERVKRHDALALADLEKNPDVKAGLVKAANSAYTLTDQKAQLERASAVTAAQKSADTEADAAQKKHDTAVKDAAKARADTMKALREDDVKAAQANLAKLNEIRDRELAADKDNVVKKLATAKDYAAQTYALQLQINKAEYDKAVREANNGRAQERPRLLATAQTTLDAANLAARNAQSGTITTATDAQTSAVQKQRDAYSKLADSMRVMVKDGSLTADSLQSWMKDFNTLGRETDKLGLTNDRYVKGARVATFALKAQGIEAQGAAVQARAAAGEFDKIEDGGRRVTQGFTVSIQDALAALPKGTDAATAYLNVLKLMDTEGHVAAGAIDAVTKAIDLQAQRIQAMIDMTLADPSLARGQTDPNNPIALANRGLGFKMPGATGTADALGKRTAPRLNPDGTPYVDPGVDARTGDTSARDAAYAAFQVTEAQKAYTDGLKDMTLSELRAEEATARRLKDLVRLPLILSQIDTVQKSIYANSGPVLPASEQAWIANMAAINWQKHVDGLKGLTDGQLAAALAAATAAHDTAEYNAVLAELKTRVKDDAGSLGSFVSGIESLGSALGGLQTAAGTALTAIGGVLKLGAQFKDWQKQAGAAFGAGGTFFDKLGAIGGGLGMVSSAIGLVGQLGDAIMNLSPGFQAWKKGLLEVAAAEQAAMGSAKYGNSIANPFFAKLKADSEALTAKANAGFWQRVGWAIFGGAPATLDKAAAEALTIAGQTFNDFASGLYGSLESALMNAFDSGNFDGVAASVEKSLNSLVAKMYLQTLIAKSNISKDIEALANDQAAGKSITGDLARLKGDTSSVIAQFQQGSAALPGFGAGAASATGSSGPSSIIGAGPSQIYGAAQITFSPEALSALSNAFNPPIMAFGGHIDRFGGYVTRLEALEMRSGMTQRSGLSGLSG